MTKFWRDGFWRTSVYGVEHWVEGHWVDRDDWSRDSYGATSTNYWNGLLQQARAQGSATARFVNPNANCPVCGAEVFFFQNEHGSRVFFDELGPPWPKHPCTDSMNMSSRKKRISSAPAIKPEIRHESDIRDISHWLGFSKQLPEWAYLDRYGTKPWIAARLVERLRGKSGVYFVVAETWPELGKKRFLFCKSLPGFLKRNVPVFLKRGTIAFLNIDTLEPQELSVRRIRNAATFIDEIVTDKDMSLGEG